MFNRGGYLQQVTLIESQCEPRRKPMNNLLGTTMFHKSPLRDRQNKMNVANTPSRIGKPSLSPLRSRRTESNMSIRSGFNKRKADVMCRNENNKIAKFVSYMGEEAFYYCEKCAILVASQGFTVMKLAATQSYEHNPRKQEIDGFLSELQALTCSLTKKQQQIQSTLSIGNRLYNDEVSKVEDYYAQFYEIIDQHKRRVLQELKQQFDQASQSTLLNKTQVQTAITDSNSMKDDILQSINIILHETEEIQFRPIMNSYQQKLKGYRSLNNIGQTQIHMRKLDFKDPEVACNALDEGLQIQWEEQKNSMNYYSKQSQTSENPVEIIETEQKFTKSSLKQIGNLFSSFDQ